MGLSGLVTGNGKSNLEADLGRRPALLAAVDARFGRLVLVDHRLADAVLRIGLIAEPARVGDRTRSVSPARSMTPA